MDAQKFNELLGITGGKKDIKEIAEKYYDSVKAHITWRFKGLVDPDDAVQDIFLKMMEYEFKYYVDYPATWIYRFADNCVIDALRKMRPTEELPETVRVVHFELEDTVVRDEVKRAMLKLDKLAQRILYMFYWEKYELIEVAAELKMSYVSVRAKVSRSYKKLKEFLKS